MRYQIQRAILGSMCAFFLSGLFAANAAADGITNAEAGNSALDGSFKGSGADTGSANGSAVYSASGTSTATDGSASQTWSAFASASATDLKASASSTITCSTNCADYTIPGNNPSRTGGDAWFDSELTVVPGSKVVSLHFVFSVDGTIASTGSLTGSAQLVGLTCGIGGGFCYAPEPSTRDLVNLGSGSNTVTLNMKPWAYGQPFNVEFVLFAEIDDYNIDANGNYYLGGPGSASVNFADTAKLVAIQAVDANGNVVKDGTVIYDDNGISLPGTVAVPEPATLGSIAIGLAVLGASRLKKRSA